MHMHTCIHTYTRTHTYTHTRTHACARPAPLLQAMYELLVRKPEGEAKLLTALVNKLGDPNRKIASRAGYLMAQLLLQHPVMKPIVAREVGAAWLAGEGTSSWVLRT